MPPIILNPPLVRGGFFVRQSGTETGTAKIQSRLCRVRSHAHQLLAEISAFQEPHECAGRAVEPLGDELLVLHLALAHPTRHVAQEVAMARSEIADDEASDG